MYPYNINIKLKYIHKYLTFINNFFYNILILLPFKCVFQYSDKVFFSKYLLSD